MTCTMRSSSPWRGLRSSSWPACGCAPGSEPSARRRPIETVALTRALALFDRRRRVHAVALHAALDLVDHCFEYGDSRVAFRVCRDQVPARVWLVARSGDHVLDRRPVVGALLAVPPVLVGQLPRLQRVLLAAFEPLQLLV